MFIKALALAATLAGTVIAQDQCNLLPVAAQTLPLKAFENENQTLCERYTPSNSTQYEWIKTLVNLAFTGDYVPLPNLWPAVPNGTYQATGILDPVAVYRDPCYTVTKINLVPFFNGTWKSNNRNGKAAAVNFLDDGADLALKANVPAWGTTSNQYKLFTAFYSYFGIILGCNDPSFPKYTGPNSQASVHRFMDIAAPQMHYFIHNIYDAAVSLGVEGPNLITHVGDAISIGVGLDNIFNKQCSPPQVVATYQPAAAQDMCSNNATCAHWAFSNSTCTPYEVSNWGIPPAPAGLSTASCNPHAAPSGYY